jgi:glycosyltransferase 2 family protein
MGMLDRRSPISLSWLSILASALRTYDFFNRHPVIRIRSKPFVFSARSESNRREMHPFKMRFYPPMKTCRHANPMKPIPTAEPHALALTLSKPPCYGAIPETNSNLMPSSPDLQRPRQKRFLLLIVALVALGLFLYKFRNSITLQGFHWRMVAQSLRQARLSLLLLSLVAVYGCYALRALRWIRLTRTLGKSRFANVYPATLMGFASVFLLGRAGEPIRPILIAKKDSLSIPGMFGGWALERALDMACTAVMAVGALLVFRNRGFTVAGDNPMMRFARPAAVVLFAALAAVIAFLIYFRFHGSQWLAHRLRKSAWQAGWRAKIALTLEGFSEGLQGIRTWADLGVLVAYSVAHWALVILIYVWIAHAFGSAFSEIDFGGAMLVVAFTLVGSAAQLPGVGGGAQLATFLVLTLIFGVEKEPAATVSIILWLITFAGVCLVGLPLLFVEGWSMGELRRLAAAEKEIVREEEAEELYRIARDADERPK